MIARACTLRAVALAAALLLQGDALHSQLAFELGPSMGVYVQPGTFQSAAPPSVFYDDESATSRHGTALLLGAQGTVWFGPRFGISAQWGTAAGTVRSRSLVADPEQQPSRVSIGAVQGLIIFRLPSLEGEVHAGLGVGVVRRGGEFFDAYDAPSNAAAVVSLGSRFPWGERLRIHLGMDSYLYSFALTEPDGTTFESTFQADVTARVGLSWRLGS